MIDADALIHEIITKTHPRIRVLTWAMMKAAEADVNKLMPAGTVAPPLTDAQCEETVQNTWDAALKHVAISLLWALTDKCVNGECLIDAAAVHAAAVGLDDVELVRGTGVAIADTRTVLAAMANVFLDMVKEGGDIETKIDRKPVRFRYVPFA